jgi:hypothetical protein
MWSLLYNNVILMMYKEERILFFHCLSIYVLKTNTDRVNIRLYGT